MTHLPPHPWVLLDDKRGVVLLEFLIAFVPLWTFFLCVVQVAFFARANLMVKHAADSAARSAVVVLPDDPNEYGGEPEMTVARKAILANPGRSRLNTIRLAAHVPLMPLAPTNVGHDSRPSLAKAIGGKRSLLSALYYQPFALAVTFPGLQESTASEPEITVRVTYAYQCTVPLARRILCQAFGDLAAQEELSEVFVPVAQSFVGGRFRGFQHETTLMIHDAPYAYRARGS